MDEVFFVVYWNHLQRGWEVTAQFPSFEQASGAYDHIKTQDHVREAMIVQKIGGTSGYTPKEPKS